MSVAVCRSPASGFESILMLTRKETVDTTLPLPRLEEPAKTRPTPPPPPAQFDIWSSIQAQKKAQQPSPPPYVHHRLTRSSSGLFSQKSLDTCTESLGSESGSEDLFSSDDESEFFSSIHPPVPSQKREKLESEEPASLKRSNSRAVNYHCSISRKSSSAPRSFPPPLPSISRRDGPCFQMRPHRRDGRLVVEAVVVPSQNYLHAKRQNGRLLLSFINTTTSHPNYRDEAKFEQVEEEEEEVEVVDRGTMVEVKVSTQPQQQSKVHRSSIVINKFVSCTPLTDQNSTYSTTNTSSETETETTLVRPVSPVRRLQSTATTTAAAAAVAASSVSAFSEAEGGISQQSIMITTTTDNKLLFTSKRRNREELLHDMRRCSQLKKPLFIWEPCCIATSS